MAANPVDAAPPAQAPAAAPPAAAAPAAAPPSQAPAAPAEWFLAEGVKGTAAAPEWYDRSKYKTLADQAKAYPEARSKIGELETKLREAGAAPKAPESYVLPELAGPLQGLEWKADDPLLAKAFEVAKKHNISQETFNALALETIAPLIQHYEMLDLEAEKAAIGDRADERMGWLKSWAEKNLAPEQSAHIGELLGRWSQPRDVFKGMEMLLAAATKQPSLAPRAGDATTGVQTTADWNAKWYAKSDVKGYKLKIDEPGMREQAREELRKIAPGDHIEVVGKR